MQISTPFVAASRRHSHFSFATFPLDSAEVFFWLRPRSVYSAGEMKSLAKNCSPLSLPSSCLVGKDKDTKEPLKVCYRTCSGDACNWSSASLQQMLNLLR